MTIRDFLNKYKRLSERIVYVDYHIGLLYLDLKELKEIFPELKKKSDDVILSYIERIYRKCDLSNPEYEEDFDIEMVRRALNYIQYPIRKNRSFDLNQYFEPNTDWFDGVTDFSDDLSHYSKH